MWKRFGVVVILLVMTCFLWNATVWSEPLEGSGVVMSFQPSVVFASAVNSPDPNIVFSLINKARKDYGAPPLRANEKLGEIAKIRAADMANRQYFAHKDPDGTYYYDLLADAGLNPDYSCENLDLLFTQSDQTAISDWLNSHTGHRECALNPNLVEAGYATTQLTRVNLNGETTTTYLVVAIHATQL